MPPNALNDHAQLKAYDPSDMLGAILGLPAQCEEAKRIAAGADLGALAGRRYSSIVIAGMGGSAIGGDLLRATFEPWLTCPVTVVRDYSLPAYVGPDTLFIAASNSGNTEETLSTYAQARRAGAPILAVTTGGKLDDHADADGVPLIKLPATGMQPRAAVGYAFIPLVVAAVRLGLLPDSVMRDVDETAGVLLAVSSRLGPDIPPASNPAKQLANAWVGKIPFVYGSQAERGVVAYRWKTQVEENAKALAVANVFPELNHNETVGWSGTHGQAGVEKHIAVVILRDRSEPAHIVRRVELTKELLADRHVRIDEAWSTGSSALARTMSLVYTGDFASCYLALAYGEDPTPVKAIDWLKFQLAKT
ncbi:MAG TPA: bifunctional phosphoglucose/phosphomannose isomerase [Candidatus Eremiobacteraceae bacterium]|nr:bifunctional phosphoglucose/phosphomannose isomerase [Candidatus Eremiobacteraceae bacterium]